MNNDDFDDHFLKFIATIILTAFIICFIILTINFFTQTNLYANGTVTGLKYEDPFYKYDITIPDGTVKGIKSTNYYEYNSNHTIIYIKSLTGIHNGQFV